MSNRIYTATFQHKENDEDWELRFQVKAKEMVEAVEKAQENVALILLHPTDWELTGIEIPFGE